MPIKSYIALAHDGQHQQMIAELSAIEQCELTLSTNKEVVILITDTANEDGERALKRQLESLPSLKFLTMVAGYATTQ